MSRVIINTSSALGHSRKVDAGLRHVSSSSKSEVENRELDL
jgi:hypothetical protein